MSNSTEKKDFVVEMKKWDAELQSVEIPLGSKERFAARIGTQTATNQNRLRLLVSVGGVAAAALIFLGLFLFLGRSRTALDFSVVSASESFDWGQTPDGSLKIVSGSAVLKSFETSVQLDVSAGSQIRQEPQFIRIVAGEVGVRVLPEPVQTRKARFGVSHGFIEVQGTHFTVRQRADGGDVTLHSGHISFLTLKGQSIEVLPNQTLTWPLVEETSTRPDPSLGIPQSQAVSPKKPAESNNGAAKVANIPKSEIQPSGQPQGIQGSPATPPQDIFDLSAFSIELDQLRIQHRFEELIKLIESSLDKIESRELQESLNYESGDILTHRLQDPRRACLHWKKHLERFPSGRYLEKIRVIQRQLDCPLE